MLFKIFTSGLICVKLNWKLTHMQRLNQLAYCWMLISVITLQIPELHQTHLHEDIESEDQAIPSSTCYSHCHQGVNSLGWPVQGQGVRYLILTPCHSHGLLRFASMPTLPKLSINHPMCLWGVVDTGLWLCPLVVFCKQAYQLHTKNINESIDWNGSIVCNSYMIASISIYKTRVC